VAYSDSEVKRRIHKPISKILLYELLPQVIREGDADGVLEAYFGAVEEEYKRNRESIQDVLLLVDPLNINRRFVIEGNPAVSTPEQYITISGATSTTVTFDGSPTGATADDFYNKFGIYVLSDEIEPDSVGQYRKIEDYTGSTKIALIDRPWNFTPSNSALLVLCWPDRVWVPTEVVGNPASVDGTVLPDQASIPVNDRPTTLLLPSLFYISDIPGYYKDWSIVFLDGQNDGFKYKIGAYSGPSHIATLQDRLDKNETNGTWFKLVPPEGNLVGTSDNYYKDRWIRVVSVTQDPTWGVFPLVQTRRIIKSVYDPLAVPAHHVCYVHDAASDEGELFENAPAPDGYIGIANHNVSLSYLAQQIGYTLDTEDPEEFQREQLRSAFNFYKLKGTNDAIELICNTFGLRVRVAEQASDYTSSPDPIAVGPSAVTPAHHRYPWGTIQAPLLTGRGRDDVPNSYNTEAGSLAARIPDSDIKIYLQRYHPKVAFDGGILRRIVRKLSEVIPIHVEIVLIAFLEEAIEHVAVDVSMSQHGTFTVSEGVGVAEGFIGSPVGTVPVDIDEGVVAAIAFEAVIPARHDVLQDRHDVGKFGAITRFDRGTIVSS